MDACRVEKLAMQILKKEIFKEKYFFLIITYMIILFVLKKV